MGLKLLAGFGKRLKAARLKEGYSQSGLADAVGVTEGYISLLEAEKRAPSLAAVEVLAHVLKVAPQRLLAAGRKGK